MRVLLYEWCCSGGWHGPDAARLLPGAGGTAQRAAVTAEGRAMLAALARDAVRDPDLDVTVLVDEAALPMAPADGWPDAGAVRVSRVRVGAELDLLLQESARADWTVVVAPESCGLLGSRVAAVRAAGGRPAACGSRVIDIAADKQATATALAAAGVPVPAGRLLEADEPLPDLFHLPAVRKSRSGAGCEDLVIVRHRGQPLPPAAGPQRLEAFAAGTPVGVSCLCGPAGTVVLPPVRQRFSSGDTPRYLGGTVSAAAAWRYRAERLATRAIAAVVRAAGATGPAAAATGWVGVDMVLGGEDDGSLDRVLEVNPRLTTSVVGLAAAAERSLVRSMLDGAAGMAAVSLPGVDRAVDFDATGQVRDCDA